MVDKKDVLKIIQSNSEEDINNLLIEKGKEPKAICPIVFNWHKKEEKENNNGEI